MAPRTPLHTLPAFQRAHSLGAAAWPEVVIPAERFAAFLEDKVPGGADRGAALEALHGADLYLACGCADGDPAALAAFDRAHFHRPAALLGAARDAAELGAEVAQELRQRLLAMRGEEPPRIAEYTGRGPLQTWVRVAAARVASNLRRSDDARARLAESAPEAIAAADPELSLLKARTRKSFEKALREGFATLSAEDRNLLRMRFLDGLNIDKLAVLLRVHRATAARRVQAAREQVLQATLDNLQRSLQVSKREMEELLALVRSRLEVSLRELFQQK